MDVARGDELTLLAVEGRVIDREEHAHRGLVHGDGIQRLGRGDVGERLADLEALNPDERTDVARGDALDLGTAEALEDVDLLDAHLRYRAIALAEGDVLPLAEGTAVHTPHGDTPHVARVVERGDEHLCGALDLLGRGDLLDDGVEEDGDVLRGGLVVLAHPALLGRAIDGLEVQLLLARVEAKHQVEDHVLHLLGTAVGLVHLVDDDDGLEPHLDGLLQDEARLRHGALEGVDEQQAAIGEVEHALYLTAEVGVPRRVDDVDLDVLVAYAYVLGEDGDPALPLEIIII